MTDAETNPEPEILAGRWILDGATPGAVLTRLPRCGRVMVVLSGGGATHERIGPVDSVLVDDLIVTIRGTVHNAIVETDRVLRIALDTTSVMRGKTYPALSLLDEAGEVLVNIVGMEDAGAFLAGFDGFTRTPVAPREKADQGDTPAEVADDPGMALLCALAERAVPVTISLALQGRSQSWSGTIGAVKPAMGFANVMTPDFHLHLKAGAVATWVEAGGRHYAYDAGGQDIGLVLSEEASA